MIKVFKAYDRDFSSNGDIILRPLKAKIHKEDNGAYYLDLESGLEYVDFIISGNIIVANGPNGEQAFRISNPKKTKSKITVRAYHVFYDSKNYLIADAYIVEQNCNNALVHLNNATEPKSIFSVNSDVAKTDSFRCVRKPLYEAVQTVLERWGGHLERNNFEFSIRNHIGKDNGINIQYRKNMKDISVEENWDNVVTKLLPVGKDGLLLNAIDENASLYVVSEQSYEIPFTKTVSFTQELIEDDYSNESLYKQALIDDLLIKAQNYVKKNCVPQVNYTLKANIEQSVDIGDTINVIDERFNLQLTTEVISYDYDCISKMYTEISFGNFKKNLSGLIPTITSSVDKNLTSHIDTVAVSMSNKLQQTKAEIQTTLGGSYVLNEGYRILIVDNLPKENAINVIKIDSSGISFSTTGINGLYSVVWSIDNTFNIQNTNITNFAADIIKGGTLKLGAIHNSNGIIKFCDSDNNTLGQIDNSGVTIYTSDGGTIRLNGTDELAKYDGTGNELYRLSEISLNRNVITLKRNERVVDLTENIFIKVPLNWSEKNGNKLISTLDGSGVEIGSSVSKIVVSGQICVETNNNEVSSREIVIVKGSYASENVLASSKGNSLDCCILSTLCNIQGGETIYLMYRTTNANDEIINATLTVEIVS